ncbi:MAG: DUF4437 domain-containing protein [Woeseia sp.]
MRFISGVSLLFSLAVLAGCAASRPNLPYPAFVQADELPDVFFANLPGARAKQFIGDARTRRSSNRVVLPANWSGTSGAAPDKSLELYVLYGEMKIGDLTLRPGGYAYFPPGFHGSNLSTAYGVELLYFLDDANPANIIRTPIIYSSEIVDWQPVESATSGVSVKEMRSDPGSGARTYLLRVTPQATTGWIKRAAVLEGYLISGRYQGSECFAGKPITGVYTEGGYFHRSAGIVSGGPQEKALEASVWLLRTLQKADVVAADCSVPTS